MKVCIRCNPVSLLNEHEDGSLSCQYHGKNYLLEEQPDPVAATPAPTPAPTVETVTYPDGTSATGTAPLPLESPTADASGQQPSVDFEGGEH